MKTDGKILTVTRSVLLGFLLSAGQSRLAAQQNIVQNGDFDQGWAYWGWTYNVSWSDAGTVYVYGTLFQDLATTPGQLYHLRFDLAGNPNTPLANVVNVVWDGSTIGTVSWTSGMPWLWCDYDVLAQGATTRLEFDNPYMGDWSQRLPKLDTVSVVAVPEPASVSLIILGALAALGIRFAPTGNSTS